MYVAEPVTALSVLGLLFRFYAPASPTVTNRASLLNSLEAYTDVGIYRDVVICSLSTD